MKTLFLSLILCMSITENYAQYFMGKVKYRVEPRNPNPALMSDEEYRKKNPNLSAHYETMVFKDNKYKYTNGNKIELFDPATARVYNYNLNSDTCLYQDANFSSDNMVDLKASPETDSVLGYKCEAITIKTMWGKTTYFFNRNQFKVDPTKFSNHNYKNLSAYFREAKVIPLKIVVKTAFNCNVYTATAIKEEFIDDIDFKVPNFKYPIKNKHQ